MLNNMFKYLNIYENIKNNKFQITVINIKKLQQ